MQAEKLEELSHPGHKPWAAIRHCSNTVAIKSRTHRTLGAFAGLLTF